MTKGNSQYFNASTKIKKRKKLVTTIIPLLYSLCVLPEYFSKRERKAQGEPWNANRLILFCTFETLLLNAEGTELIRQEKATAITQCLALRDRKNPY